MKVSHPQRILYVITKANWGGAQRYVYDLATEAHNRGHEVCVVYGTPGELAERLAQAKIPSIHMSSLGRDIKLGSDFKAVSTLTRIIADFSPDVLHTNSSKAGLLAAIAGRITNISNIVFTAHGWAFNESRPWWQRQVFFLLHFATVLLSHTTICVSDAMKMDARKMPFVQRKLVIIHNGIKDAPLLERAEVRAKLAPFLKQPFWIGTVAELHPTKQLDILIDSFSMISDNNALALVIIGSGSEQQRLRKRIQTLGLQNQIILTGHIPNAPSYLQAFDLFALPSRSEALGYVLLEAGLASLPVVASRVGGIPEIILHNKTGILVTAGDHCELTNALEAYISDPELRKNHGSALHARVTNEFSFMQMCEKTFNLY